MLFQFDESTFFFLYYKNIKLSRLINKNQINDAFTSSNLLILENEIYFNDLLYLIFQLTIQINLYHSLL